MQTYFGARRADFTSVDWRILVRSVLVIFGMGKLKSLFSCDGLRHVPYRLSRRLHDKRMTILAPIVQSSQHYRWGCISFFVFVSDSRFILQGFVAHKNLNTRPHEKKTPECGVRLLIRAWHSEKEQRTSEGSG